MFLLLSLTCSLDFIRLLWCNFALYRKLNGEKGGQIRETMIKVWNMNNWSNRCFVSCVFIVSSVIYAFVSR